MSISYPGNNFAALQPLSDRDGMYNEIGGVAVPALPRSVNEIQCLDGINCDG